jgi:iron complex transport system substrate-binding protein
MKNCTLILIMSTLAAAALAAAALAMASKQEESLHRERAARPGGEVQPCTVLDETPETVTTLSGDGREVVLRKNPGRTIILMNSLLDLWYLSGGTAVGRVQGSTNVPEQAADIAVLGHVANPVLERILSLNPDLVILSGTITDQLKLLEPLEENGIQNIVIPYDTYEDFLRISDLFIRLNGPSPSVRGKIASIEREVQHIAASVPRDAEQPRVLILFASMGTIMAERSAGHTGAMVRDLGGVNIADDPSFGRAGMIPFSMELIVAGNPEVVLIVTMGDLGAIKGMINRSIESNEAWAGIEAVRNGRVHYLPNYYFLYKPNEQYPEAFAYLADILYPGTVE